MRLAVVIRVVGDVRRVGLSEQVRKRRESNR
jgi:hypothetical protein